MLGRSEEAGSYNIIIGFEALGNKVLDNKDILECYVIEDIFSFCMTGKLSMIDQLGLSEYGPLTGNEKLYILLGDQEGNSGLDSKGWFKKWSFDIYKIQKLTQAMTVEPHARPVWEIFFTDPNFKKLTEKRFNKAWPEEPTKASDIWLHILGQMAEIGNFGSYIEPSKSKDIKNFHMPWWTPIEAIQWLMRRAKGAEMGVPGYLMFANSKDTNITLNYCTLEKLLRQEETDPNIYLFESDNMYYRNKILSWKRQGLDHQSIKSLMGGVRLGFDFTQKTRIDNVGPVQVTYGSTITYNDAESNFTTLGRKNLYPDISTDPNWKPGFVELTGHDEAHYLNDINYNEWVKRYNLQQAVAINVRGFEGNGRHAGSMIKIEWPSELKEEFLNKNLRGKYLVKSVTHTFARSKPNWTQKLTLIKNGYYNPDSSKLKSSSRANP
jgi:hypothetical protein